MPSVPACSRRRMPYTPAAFSAASHTPRHCRRRYGSTNHHQRRDCSLIPDRRLSHWPCQAPIIALVRLLRNYSGAPIVGLVSRLGNTPYQDLIDIGLTDVVRIDRDDELLVVQAHANDETRSGARALTVRRITGILPPVSLRVATAIALQSTSLTRLDEIAKHLGASVPSLRRRIKKELAMSPLRLEWWCRLLLGSAILERTSATLLRTCESVGVADTRTLNHVSKTLIGVASIDLRSPGSFERCVQAFETDIKSNAQAACLLPGP